MLRVGGENNGVVMAGSISSLPRLGEDWRKEGREVYYSDLYMDFIVDPDKTPLLTSERLTKAIPDFDWNRGHSGLRLNADQAFALDEMFNEYKTTIPKVVNKLRKDRDLVVQKSVLDNIEGGHLWDEMFDWIKNKHDRYTEYATRDCDLLSFSASYSLDMARLSVRFRNNSVLHILCFDMCNFTAEFAGSVVSSHSFELSKPYNDAYMLQCRGVKIICGNIIFENATEL